VKAESVDKWFSIDSLILLATFKVVKVSVLILITLTLSLF